MGNESEYPNNKILKEIFHFETPSCQHDQAHTQQ